jgi:hypothetical protein
LVMLCQNDPLKIPGQQFAVMRKIGNLLCIILN